MISGAGAVNLKRSLLVDGLRALHFALLPPHCLLCGLDGDARSDLCRGCEKDLTRNAVACARCALPLTLPGPMCGECLQIAPPFDAGFAPFVYGYPIDHLLTRLKFGRHLAAGSVLSRVWLDAFAASNVERPRAIIPVPLHPARLRERGFNQALELAHPIARAIGIPIRSDLLARTRATAPQSDLDAAARRRNLRGAFEVCDPRGLLTHVALLDDVMTTGSTLRECARTLRRAGVERIDVWAIARAPK